MSVGDKVESESRSSRLLPFLRFPASSPNRSSPRVRTAGPLGLFPGDKLYLWGLLALTLAQPEADGSLDATPHWCLRQLGLIDAGTRRGGRQYQQFAAALERLSAVSYLSSACYDPVRGEYRQVSFRFFSYSLPANSKIEPGLEHRVG